MFPTSAQAIEDELAKIEKERDRGELPRDPPVVGSEAANVFRIARRIRRRIAAQCEVSAICDEVVNEQSVRHKTCVS